MPTLKSISIAVLGLALTACATNKITGRSQAMLVSDDAAAQQSYQAYSQLLSQAAQKRALDDDPYQLTRVQSIAKPLIQQAIKLRRICPECNSLMMEGTKTIPERCSNKSCRMHNPHKLEKK